MEDLARRAVACPGWKWVAGMHAILDNHRFVVVVIDDETAARALPDLGHPATRGCILELIREARNDRGVHISPHYVPDEGLAGWHVWPMVQTWDFAHIAEGATEEEALVIALEESCKPS